MKKYSRGCSYWILSEFSPSYLPSAREWFDALRWVLLVFTLLIAFALAGSFFDYQAVVAHGHPWLAMMKPCAGCLFCGMTRGFCAMSDGRAQDAWSWNHGAPFLYTIFWLWTLAFLVFAARKLIHIAKPRTRF